MITNDNFNLTEIIDFFTLPNGDQDGHTVEVLCDVLTERLRATLTAEVFVVVFLFLVH